MRLARASDIHLNHATNTVRQKFYQAVDDQADALVLCGHLARSFSGGDNQERPALKEELSSWCASEYWLWF